MRGDKVRHDAIRRFLWFFIIMGCLLFGSGIVATIITGQIIHATVGFVVGELNILVAGVFALYLTIKEDKRD